VPAFDTQQRLDLIRTCLEWGVHRVPSAPPRVLDVGGHPGLLATTLQERGFASTTLDTPAFGSGAYVCGTGHALPFPDRTFSAVVASDVLEHIPADQRVVFLTELTRATAGWVLVGAPFNTPPVAQAETGIQALSTRATGRPNPWLEEHCAYGLPDLPQTRQTLQNLGFASLVIPNGSLVSWFLLQAVETLLNALPNAFDQAGRLSDLYLRHWGARDHQPPVYRHLILAHRDRAEVEKRATAPFPDPVFTIIGPDLPVPLETEESGVLADLARFFQDLMPSLLENRQTGGGFEAAYVRNLERIVQHQESERERLEAELAALRQRVKEQDSSLAIRAWRRLKKICSTTE
jgi:hypothetical protein